MNQQDVHARHLGIEVLVDLHDTGRLRAGAVRADRHEIDVGVKLELASQVGHEDDGTLEYTHEEHVALRIVTLDVARHLGNAIRDLVLGKQDLAQVAPYILDIHQGPLVLCGSKLHGKSPSDGEHRRGF